MSEMMFPEQIQKRINAGMQCGSNIDHGWIKLVDNLDIQISQIDPDYKIDQIKEKFGSLCYYVTLSDHLTKSKTKQIYEMIASVEDMSIVVCERCGQPGERRNIRGWMKTLCEQDTVKIIKELEEK